MAPLVFTETPSVECLQIEIVDDGLVEDSEEFEVSVTTNDPAVDIDGVAPATVTIIDTSGTVFS